MNLFSLRGSLFFKKDFIYLFIFKERGREGKREGEKHQYSRAIFNLMPIIYDNTRRGSVVASCEFLTGDLAHNPGMCPDRELNLPPFDSQAGAQSTELQQPGQKSIYLS